MGVGGWCDRDGHHADLIYDYGRFERKYLSIIIRTAATLSLLYFYSICFCSNWYLWPS